jgi:exodeoxyribonuclease V alpha subunit
METIFEAFPNENGGYCVYSCKVIEPDHNCKADDIITIRGSNIPKSTGLRYNVDGAWKSSQKYGLQFSVSAFEEIIPKSYTGIIGYLSSGRITGITPAIAELIYCHFRNESIDVLDEETDRLKEVPGISSTKCKQIIEAYENERVFKRVILHMKKYNITDTALKKAYKAYHKNLLDAIKKNPYILNRFGVSYTITDRMARDYQIPKEHTGKAEAVILDSLKSIERMNGNVCAPAEVFYKTVMSNAYKYRISRELLSAAENRLVADDQIVYVNNMVFRKNMYETENACVREIFRIINGFKIDINFDIDEEIRKSEKILKCRLHTNQREAVKQSITNGILIITGGPGTGKTTVIKVLHNVFERVLKKSMLFLAPTGRAAARMKESTSFPAYTIHKNLLINDDTIEEPSSVRVTEDCTICDETSMLDMFVLLKFLQSIPTGKQAIFLGDVEQLPSVGPGAVLRDMINSGFVPTVYLTKVFRQSSTSNIYLNCRKIVKGNLSLEYGEDFVLIDAYNQEEAADLMADAFIREVEEFGIEEVCCLCPFRKTTLTGVISMNKRIQGLINPPSPEKPELIQFVSKTIFRLGDRIMNLRNTDKACNGDLGFISEVGVDYVIAKFNDVEITYSYEDLDQITLAYAMTIHKSQGSEFKSVISTMIEDHGDMLQMNLFNTAVSRAKARFTLAGNEKAINMAILNRGGISRNTMMCEKIIAYFTTKRNRKSDIA